MSAQTDDIVEVRSVTVGRWMVEVSIQCPVHHRNPASSPPALSAWSWIPFKVLRSRRLGRFSSVVRNHVESMVFDVEEWLCDWEEEFLWGFLIMLLTVRGSSIYLRSTCELAKDKLNLKLFELLIKLVLDVDGVC